MDNSFWEPNISLTDSREATLEDLERELWIRERNYNKILWKTKEGKKIPINDMSDTHLINTIKLLARLEAQQELIGDVDPFGN